MVMRCLEAVGFEPFFPVVCNVVTLEPNGPPLLTAIGHVVMTAVRVLLDFASDHAERVSLAIRLIGTIEMP